MRWQDLLADLEAEWRALAAADRQADVAERTRAEYAQVRLVDRLRGSQGRHVELRTRSGRDLAGELHRVGADFALIGEGPQEAVVPLWALDAVRGLADSVAAEASAGAVASRLGLGSALRRIAADRSVVRVRGPGVAVGGTLHRVGADFVEVAEHPLDTGPRPADVRRFTVVPMSAIEVLQRDAGG